MTKTTTLRLRRVRFKDGRTLEVLRPKQEVIDRALRGNFSRMVERVLAEPLPMSGYVIMAWDKDHSSLCQVQSDGGIPKALVPDFVRNRLLGDIIEDWTIDTLKGR